MVPSAGDVVAVAALSARWLAESARAAGWRVVALDLFGDVDTQDVAVDWTVIGDAADPRIDGARLRAALADARLRHGAIGWIAGPGLDADPRLLDAGGTLLPRWGMATDAIAAVRDPRRFFAALDAAGLAHPGVAWRAPADPRGWLTKRAGGSGGWHIRPAAASIDGQGKDRPGHDEGDIGVDAHADSGGEADRYWQRHEDGLPMSVLALADGREARLVALNRLHVRALSRDLPCVYLGADGPVDDVALEAEVGRALRHLVPAFGLRGLFSADFLCRDGRASWLEINPRPSATMALHDAAWPGGLLAAHRAALEGQLPGGPARHGGARCGVRTVLADRPWRIDDALSARLGADPAVHDRPRPGSVVGAGEPLCSVSARVDAYAQAPAAAAPVRAGAAIGAALDRAEQRLRQWLQAAPPPLPSRLESPTA